MEVWGRKRETHLLKTNQGEAGSSESFTAVSSRPGLRKAWLALWPPGGQTVQFGHLGRDLLPSIEETNEQ